MAGIERGPLVGVIMGSDSDMGTMRETGQALREAGLQPIVDYEFRVVSAHRTPHFMTQYAEEAAERGLQVIVAGAGGSAHLPGMVASETTLPVAGVAVTSNPSTLNRALGSLIGMPEGKPLATFQAKAGAYQAGVFASRIILRDPTATRVGIVINLEEELETMHHVGRALSTLGLQEDADYEYLPMPSDNGVPRPHAQKAWAGDKGFGVLIACQGDTSRSVADKLGWTTNLPVLGVALPRNPDYMGVALEALTYPDAPGSNPAAAFQGPAGAFNAGLEAARILALDNPSLLQSIKDYDEGLRVSNGAKDKIMARLGDLAYDALDKESLQRLIDTELAAAETGRGE